MESLVSGWAEEKDIEELEVVSTFNFIDSTS